MKVLADRELLLDAFNIVSAAVPAKTPKDILFSVKLVAGPDGVELMATDLDVGIRRKVLGVKVDTPGEMVIPAAKLGQILRSVRDGELSIESVEATKKVQAGIRIAGLRAEFKLPSEDASLFPEPAGMERAEFVVLGEALRKAIRRTVVATDSDSTRYALSGVQFTLSEEGEQLCLTGTDGRRLAIQRIPSEPEPGGGSSPEPVVIPSRALKLVDRAIDESEGVRITLAKTGAVFASGETVITTRTVEGRFPNVKAVIPKSFGKRVEFGEASDLADCVEQAKVTTANDSRGIKCEFESGRMVLGSQTADMGESRVELPVDYEGEAVAMTIDGVYLSEMLRTLNLNQPLTLKIADPKQAVIFATDDSFMHGIMPMGEQ